MTAAALPVVFVCLRPTPSASFHAPPLQAQSRPYKPISSYACRDFRFYCLVGPIQAVEHRTRFARRTALPIDVVRAAGDHRELRARDRGKVRRVARLEGFLLWSTVRERRGQLEDETPSSTAQSQTNFMVFPFVAARRLPPDLVVSIARVPDAACTTTT
jgi:hypothetical protein